MSELFTASSIKPLADALRPQTSERFIGQQHLLADNLPLRLILEGKMPLHSLLLWGPPGCGKTTLAQLLAQKINARWFQISAVTAGVKDIRDIVAAAEQMLAAGDARARVLFIDECHRFNKSQQDALLPHIENGLILFIGATTENPSFEINNALLSRVSVYHLKPLSAADLKKILADALAESGRNASDGAAARLVDIADGDARRLLNALEQTLAACAAVRIEEKHLQVLSENKIRQFDKGGDHFYELISALHKSIRGSNPDAALYWFCRMLDGGADPRYIGRRLLRIASEDIGLADPRALALAMDADASYRQLGSPEGELALAQAVVYLACTAKSDAVYRAFNACAALVKAGDTLPVPAHLANAPTALMKKEGYGKGYRHAHNEKDAYAAGVHYFPEQMEAQVFYEPSTRGLEKSIGEHLKRLRRADREKS